MINAVYQYQQDHYAYENYLNEEKYKMRFLKTSTILEILNLPDGKYGICDNLETRNS